jgi:hypothetical protein
MKAYVDHLCVGGESSIKDPLNLASFIPLDMFNTAYITRGKNQS